MPWWYAVIESRHKLQNPTSAEKIMSLGERLGLGPESRVLDLGAGRAGPALILAREFGCSVTCVERAPEFVEAARERVERASLQDRIEIVQSDAKDYKFASAGYDAALCLGASFIWGGLGQTVAALVPAVHEDGFVAVGEPYWKRWPLPEEFSLDPGEEGFTTLRKTVGRFEAAGVAPVGMIVSSQDDWDRYESLHWLALEQWLRSHSDDPEAEKFREQGRRQRERYLKWERDLLGWAILIGRVSAPAG